MSDGFVIQTLLFLKSKYSVEEAKKWASAHGFKSGKVDSGKEKAEYHRLRQRDPDDFVRIRPVPGGRFPEGIKAMGGPLKDSNTESDGFLYYSDPTTLVFSNCFVSGCGDGVIGARQEWWHVPYDPYDSDYWDFLSAPFSVYGGKRNLAKLIAGLVPQCQRYVEPFAGAASVMFARNKTGEEILTDVDQEKIASLRFLQSYTDDMARALLSRPWESSKELFAKLSQSKFTDPVDRFYRFIYLTQNSFGKRRDSYTNPAHGGGQPFNHSRYVTVRMPQYRERLRGVKILMMDWKDAIQRFDSPGTFFYMDPPYIGTSNQRADHFDAPDAAELHRVISPIQGKWLLSNNDVPELRQAFAKFAVESVNVSTRVDQVHAATSKKVRPELLIANYELSGIQQQAPKIAATEEDESWPW